MIDVDQSSHPDPAPTEPWRAERGVSRVALATIVLALVWLPGGALLDWAFGVNPQVVSEWWALMPIAIGVLGGALTFAEKAVPRSGRTVWAALAVCAGLAALPFWWVVGTALLGP
ncbi:hypothetical protein [Luteococcus sp.]|uniref:hypothetical protein n=1 Tax=Luteococcus sp. TaxID=1969402 RepID=UPI0037350F59